LAIVIVALLAGGVVAFVVAGHRAHARQVDALRVITRPAGMHRPEASAVSGSREGKRYAALDGMTMGEWVAQHNKDNELLEARRARRRQVTGR
jgi:hypothetical protein